MSAHRGRIVCVLPLGGRWCTGGVLSGDSSFEEGWCRNHLFNSHRMFEEEKLDWDLMELPLFLDEGPA